MYYLCTTPSTVLSIHTTSICAGPGACFNWICLCHDNYQPRLYKDFEYFMSRPES